MRNKRGFSSISCTCGLEFVVPSAVLRVVCPACDRVLINEAELNVKQVMSYCAYSKQDCSESVAPLLSSCREAIKAYPSFGVMCNDCKYKFTCWSN
jgi:hypothetical protein